MSIILGTNRIPYDTLMPDKVVTDFLEFCRNVKSRYEGNAEEIGAREAELGDLEHYMELHSDLDCKGGYALYKKMRETRRERRKCKNEMELLRPMYDWLEQNGDALNRLTIALGDTRRKAEVIDSRKYMSRTDVLVSANIERGV